MANLDLNSLLNAAKAGAKTVASMQNNREKVDTVREKESLRTIFSGINKQIVTNMSPNTDKAEFNNFVNKAKSEVTPFFDDATLLSDLMTAFNELDPSVHAEKLDKYMDKEVSTQSKNLPERIMNPDGEYVGMTEQDFETISTVLGDDAEKVFSFMSDAINKPSIPGEKLTSAESITLNQRAFEDEYNAQIQQLRGNINITKAMGAQKDVTIAKNIMAVLQNGDDTRADFMA